MAKRCKDCVWCGVLLFMKDGWCKLLNKAILDTSTGRCFSYQRKWWVPIRDFFWRPK